MDMLDYRMHYAVMATEDRVRSFRRERHQLSKGEAQRRVPKPRREGRR